MTDTDKLIAGLAQELANALATRAEERPQDTAPVDHYAAAAQDAERRIQEATSPEEQHRATTDAMKAKAGMMLSRSREVDANGHTNRVDTSPSVDAIHRNIQKTIEAGHNVTA